MNEHEVEQALEEIKALDAAITKKVFELSNLLKVAGKAGSSSSLEKQIDDLRNEIEGLRKDITQRIDASLTKLGIDVAELDEQDASRRLMIRGSGRLWREELTTRVVTTTAWLEDTLPSALKVLLSRVAPSWLRDQRVLYRRLDEEYRREPISMILGLRPKSERPTCHRYAQALLLAEDHLNKRNDFDFHAGAVLIPQIAVLGSRIGELISRVPGAEAKFRTITARPSEEAESTIFELLVTARFLEHGFQVELPAPSAEKSPDIRILGMRFPCVVECKRQRFISRYEEEEAGQAATLFGALLAQRPSSAITGLFAIAFGVEPSQVHPDNFARDIWRDFENAPSERIFPWGSVSFTPLPEFHRFQRWTRLYSPYFMESSFGWSFETADFDGICARVAPPEDVLVKEASNLICMKWRVDAGPALAKRSRSLMDLCSDAIAQIPTGEVGFIYLAYMEGHRTGIANMRTEKIIQRFGALHHRSNISIPYLFINRFYHSAQGDGVPDLIENCMMLCASYGDPDFQRNLPTLIVCKPLPEMT